MIAKALLGNEHAELATFLDGLLGNWIAASGQHGVARSWGQIRNRYPRQALEKLLRNHHLRRASFIAQCRATEAVCANWLDDRRHQRAATGARRLRAPDWAAALMDPDMRVVAWWLRTMAQAALDVRKPDEARDRALFGLDARDLPAVLADGSEITTNRQARVVAARLTEAWIMQLERYHEQTLAAGRLSDAEHLANMVGWVSARQFGLPATLRDQLDREWYGFLCAAFRELIKGPDFTEARHALELDLAVSSGERLVLVQARLDTFAEEEDARWKKQEHRLGEIADALDAVSLQLDHLQVGMREVAEQMRHTNDAQHHWCTGGLERPEIYMRGYWVQQERALGYLLGDHAQADAIKTVVRERLVGRASWLRAFEQFLFDAHRRSYVLYGQTGAGKSRLALEAATLAASSGFQVVFISDPLDDVANRLRYLTEVLGPAAGLLSPPNRRVLVIWDNCSGRDERALRALLELPEHPSYLGVGLDVRVLITCWPAVGLRVQRTMPSPEIHVEELAPLVPSPEVQTFVARINPEALRFDLVRLLEKAEGSIELLLAILTSLEPTAAVLPNPATVLHARHLKVIGSALEMATHIDSSVTVDQVIRALRRAAIIGWKRYTEKVISETEWDALDRLGLGGPARDSFALSIVRASIHSKERGIGRLWLSDPEEQWSAELEPLFVTHFEDIVVQSMAAFEVGAEREASRMAEAIFRRLERCVTSGAWTSAGEEERAKRITKLTDHLAAISYQVPTLAARSARAIGRIAGSHFSSDLALVRAKALVNATAAATSAAECRTLAAEIGALLTLYPFAIFALLHAQALFNATVKETSRDARQALTAEIAALLLEYQWPAIAFEQAKVLYNETFTETSCAGRQSLAAEIGALLRSYPSTAIADLLAMALLNAATLETSPAERRTRAAEIGALLLEYPSAAIALAQVHALQDVGLVETSPAERRTLAAEIGALLLEYPSEAMALAQAQALVNVAVVETSPVERRTLAAEIGALLLQYPSADIALRQARALALVAGVETSADECRTRAAEIGDLLLLYPSADIALPQALALAHAAAVETSPDESRTLTAEIGALSLRYPSADMARLQASSLERATDRETTPAARRALATEIGTLVLRYPSADMARLLASALSFCTVGEPSPAVCQTLAAEIGALLLRYPSTEIACRKAVALVGATVSEPAPAARETSAAEIGEVLRFDPSLDHLCAQVMPLVGAMAKETSETVRKSLAAEIRALLFSHIYA